MKTLTIKDAEVAVDEVPILSNISLTLLPGETHWLMGPNGSGKSTLANALAGHPKYTLKAKDIRLGDRSLTEMSVHNRAQEGLFLSLQYPPALEGVTVTNLLKNAYNARFHTDVSVLEFRNILKAAMEELELPQDFTSRYVHAGFSGGEKKRLEMLQLRILEPEVAILDEPDSGLDVDGLKMLADQLRYIQQRTGMGILIITHYTQLLEYLEPNYVHVLKSGQLIQSGDQELARRIQREGYGSLS